MNQEDLLEQLMKEETEHDYKVATTLKELNPDTNQMNLKMDPSLVEPSDEIAAQANTLKPCETSWGRGTRVNWTQIRDRDGENRQRWRKQWLF